MKPSKFQKLILDAVNAICAETGRAATMQEVSTRTGRALSTVHGHVERLRRQGMLSPGPGLQPGEGEFGRGWRKGVAYAANEAYRVLEEHHADPRTTAAVQQAMQDAASAGEKR